MPIPAWLYHCLPAFLVEGSIMCIMLAQPILALDRWEASARQLGRLGLVTGGCYALLALLTGIWIARRYNLRPYMIGALCIQVASVALPTRCFSSCCWWGCR